MKLPLIIIIPLAPITKKNSQQIVKAGGRLIVVPSSQYKRYEKESGWFMPKGEHEPVDYPVNVSCTYYMPTRRKVDLVNLQEATLDILVHYGILADDNCRIVVSMDGSRVFYDKANPRTVIEIQEAGGGDTYDLNE